MCVGRQVLRSIDWARVSIGILVVEMRYNDAANNRAIFDLLKAAGYELVRSLAVWSDKILVRPTRACMPLTQPSSSPHTSAHVWPAWRRRICASV